MTTHVMTRSAVQRPGQARNPSQVLRSRLDEDDEHRDSWCPKPSESIHAPDPKPRVATPTEEDLQRHALCGWARH